MRMRLPPDQPRQVVALYRYFTDHNGNTFMPLPARLEVLDDMAATGWAPVHVSTRNELASETPKVRNFSDNCRFWVARK